MFVDPNSLLHLPPDFFANTKTLIAGVAGVLIAFIGAAIKVWKKLRVWFPNHTSITPTPHHEVKTTLVRINFEITKVVKPVRTNRTTKMAPSLPEIQDGKRRDKGNRDK